MRSVPRIWAGARRKVRSARTGGLLFALCAAVAFAHPGAAEATNSPTCGPRVDKRHPIALGSVQYCKLSGWDEWWVPVYATPNQGQNRIGTDIVGWLTSRGSSNWFWCQVRGGTAWNEWRVSSTWAKTVSDIEAGPPYRARHVRGWVPETFFANGTAPIGNGNSLVLPDPTLRQC